MNFTDKILDLINKPVVGRSGVVTFLRKEQKLDYLVAGIKNRSLTILLLVSKTEAWHWKLLRTN